MKKNIFIQGRIIIITVLIIVFTFNIAYSQHGENFDFAYGTVGNYTYWRGCQALNQSSEGSTTPTLSTWTCYNNPSDVMLGGAHSFEINSNLSEYDPQLGGNLLKKIPNGYIRSTRLNCIPNTGNPSANSNKLEYDLLVNDTNCLLTFNFAMVLMSPGHSGFANPFFKIDVVRLDPLGQETGLIEPCATFCALGNDDPVPPGFQTFPNGIWQNWKQVSMNLSSYLNETVRIKIVLASCCYTVHWAYGYFVGKVGPSTLTVNACGNGDTVATITAPPGFQQYDWYANPTDLPEYQLSTIATGTPLFTSTATATIPANNQFNIRNSVYVANGSKYFVKVTSPSSSSSIPGCVAYMKATAQTIKPSTAFADTADCQLRAEFTNLTTFPIEEEDAIKEYKWNFGDGDSVYYASDDTNTNANISPTHQYLIPGTYTVTLKAIYNGCEKEISQDIIIPATPLFTLADQQICTGAQTSISIQSPAMDDAVYSWNNPNEATPGLGNTYTATFNQRTQIVVTATTPSSACTYNDTVIIDVQQFPDITLQGDTMLCLGEQSNITAIDATGNTQAMQWSYTDPGNPPQFNPNQPTTTNPILIFTPTQNTTVWLIAQTSQGCMSSKSISISITDPKAWASKYKVCPGDEVTLYGGQAVNYSWNSNPVDATLPTNISTNPVTAHPEETTTYTMKGYGASGCFAERTVTITVIPFPLAEISYSPDYVDTDNPVLSLKDVSQYGATSHWDLSDGTTSDARSFSHRFNDVSGQYVEVHLTTFNEVNCIDTASIQVPIELFSVWVPSGFTPDGDGSNDRFFFHSLNNLSNVKFEIYNRWGTKIFSFEKEKLDCSTTDMSNLGWDGTFEGKEVPIGTYVWRLSYKRTGNERIYDKNGTINIIR
ncbi:MAG: gliding motility-associated C-terminal domain-containing protein [Bacteroidales bacterium]|jgi:gliding motility-associated-like protein